MEPWKPWDELLAELEAKENAPRVGGGLDRLEAHKAKGKLTCRERIEALVDPCSFREINALAETQTFEFDMQEKKIPRRRGRHWFRNDPRSQGLRLFSGRDRLRRVRRPSSW